MSNADVVARRNEAKGRGLVGWALLLILPILMVVMELAVVLVLLVLLQLVVQLADFDTRIQMQFVILNLLNLLLIF